MLYFIRCISDLHTQRPKTFVVLMVVSWLCLYAILTPIAEGLVSIVPIEHDGKLAEVLRFFLFDTQKVLMLLAGIVFVMGMINSYFTPERTRSLLVGRMEGAANIMAAGLGVLTPEEHMERSVVRRAPRSREGRTFCRCPQPYRGLRQNVRQPSTA